MNSGIYMILNLNNDKVYIGQSYDVDTRLRKHKEALIGNYHKNDHLQKAFNKYGEDSFLFTRMLSCPIKKLDEYEISYISQFKSDNRKYGYNIMKGGQDHRFHSLETKKKIGEKNIWKGKMPPHIAKLNEDIKLDKHPKWNDEVSIEDVVNDWNKGLTIPELCEKYDCSTTLIRTRLENSPDTITYEEHTVMKYPVGEIIKLIDLGYSQRKISRELNVCRYTVRKVQANYERFVQILSILRN